MKVPGLVTGFVLLAHLALGLALLGERLVWDAFAYLTLPEWVDVMHLLYVPTLRMAGDLGACFGLDLETSAKLVSCVCATVALAACWRCLQRAGAADVDAALCSAALAASLPFWLFAETVEVYVPSVAAVLVGLWGALLYRERTTMPRLMLALSGGLVSVGYHVAAVFAWPVLVVVATGWPPRFKPLHLAVVAATAVAVLGVLLAAGLGYATIGRTYEFVGTFMQDRPTRGSVAGLGDHAEIVWRFLVEGSPAVCALGAVGWVVGWWQRSLLWWMGSAWVVCFTLPFLWLGIPRMALLMMSQVGWVCLACAAVGHPPLRSKPWLRAGLLVGALVWQVAASLPEVLERRTPDPKRVQAEQIARSAPPNAVLFTTRLAPWLRYYGKVETHSLYTVIRKARLVHGPEVDPKKGLWAEVVFAVQEKKTPLLLQSGLDYMKSLGAAPSELFIDLEAPLRLGGPDASVQAYRFGVPSK